MSKAVEGEYKGSKTIQLHESDSATDQYPFGFGVRKAKLILAHIEDIRAFVKKNETAKD